MKTLNALKLRIMTRAFKIRIAAGEVFLCKKMRKCPQGGISAL